MPEPNSRFWTEPIRIHSNQFTADSSTASEEAMWAVFADEDTAARDQLAAHLGALNFGNREYRLCYRESAYDAACPLHGPFSFRILLTMIVYHVPALPCTSPTNITNAFLTSCYQPSEGIFAKGKDLRLGT